MNESSPIEFPREYLHAQWFTDPMCSWSFAAEDAIGEFRRHFSGQLIFQNRMFVLYKDLSRFLGAHGMEKPNEFASKIESVARSTGKRIETAAWINNTVPASSEQCCLWVKSAQLLDEEKGDLFLSEMRKAFFQDGKDISSESVVEDLARISGMEIQPLRLGLFSQKVQTMLEEDQKAAEDERVTSRPTLVLRNSGGDRIFIGGLLDPELYIHAGEVLLREA
ncbi:MAG: DsbA family protein [Leptospirales bacterium]